MKNFNWLVKMLFYKHTELNATAENTAGDPNGIFYKVGFIDQIHANLCTAASENMLYHFGGKPVATMIVNPRGVLEPAVPKAQDFNSKEINISDLKQELLTNGPFILVFPLKYNMGHSVVATGFANDHLIYHDPLTGSNKKISTSELREINASNIIDIAVPKFLQKESIAEKKRSVLDDKPQDIPTKKYANFFTLDKMSDEANQCQAIKNFLADYARNSFWTSRRTHKDEVLKFLEDNKDEVSLPTLMKNLATSLNDTADKTKGELYKRLLTVQKMCGKEEEASELEDSESKHLSSPS
jgi:hypothetical protein